MFDKFKTFVRDHDTELFFGACAVASGVLVYRALDGLYLAKANFVLTGPHTSTITAVRKNGGTICFNLAEENLAQKFHDKIGAALAEEAKLASVKP